MFALSSPRRLTRLISYIFILVMWTALISLHVNGMYPAPRVDNLCFCIGKTRLDECMNYVKSINRIPVVYITVNIALDGYLALYAGSIVDTFRDDDELKYWFIIAQPNTQLEGGELFGNFVLHAIATSPTNSVFVCLEQGVAPFGIQNLKKVKSHYKTGPRVVLHLNDEQPWRSNDNKGPLHQSVNEKAESYKVHPLVLRNYYYEPLLASSMYLPLNIPKYGYIIGNTSSEYLFVHSKVPASQRGKFCDFNGRTSYYMQAVSANMRVSDIHYCEGDVPDLTAPHVLERQTMATLHEKGLLGNCSFSAIQPPAESKDGLQYYHSYIKALADTVFVPCPSGNNPETFRHFEALELGSVPVLIQASANYSDRNFFSYGLWEAYPGPMLKSWDELAAFLDDITPEQADAIQEAVAVWYEHFKSDARSRLLAALKYVFLGKLPATDEIEID